jgi:hypothetical protein
VATFTTHVQWITRGCQRRAVVQALRRPLTESQIVAEARVRAPRIQLRDVWLCLRQCTALGLTYCLNPREATGKLYFLTHRGRKAVAAAFGERVQPLSQHIDWFRYAWVARAKIRRLALEAMANASRKTVGQIRRKMLQSHPVADGQTRRALLELARCNLIRDGQLISEAKRKQYQLTAAGRRVVAELRRSPSLGTI